MSSPTWLVIDITFLSSFVIIDIESFVKKTILQSCMCNCSLLENHDAILSFFFFIQACQLHSSLSHVIIFQTMVPVLKGQYTGRVLNFFSRNLKINFHSTCVLEYLLGLVYHHMDRIPSIDAFIFLIILFTMLHSQ